MSVFFRKIKDKEEFQNFVKESMETDMHCAGCDILTRNRGIYITKELPSRQVLYGLCSKCQERCLKSKKFAEDLSKKITICLAAENN